MPERDFLIFWIFFSEFSSPDPVWTEIGAKFFFSLFLGLSHPVLAKNNVGKRFFNFLNFFAIFFSEFSSPGRVWTKIRTKFFFFSFPAYLLPFLLKVIPERDFLIFWFFLLFFLEFSSFGWVRTEFRTKIFFPLSRPISSRFG